MLEIFTDITNITEYIYPGIWKNIPVIEVSMIEATPMEMCE